jgi:hypothetical protein
MKYVVEVGRSIMIYVQIFIKTGSGIQKSISGINIQIYRQQVDLISISLFFQNKEIMLIYSCRLLCHFSTREYPKILILQCVFAYMFGSHSN